MKFATIIPPWRGQISNHTRMLHDILELCISRRATLPVRLATALGLVTACLSAIAGIAYFFCKLIFWNNFAAGSAPLVIGLLCLGALQLISLAVIGAHAGTTYDQPAKRPYATRKERISF